VRFEFRERRLLKLYLEGKGREQYSKEVVENFLQVMRLIENAPDERTIRSVIALRLHKLKGDRKGQMGIKLSGQFRLVIEIDKTSEGKIVKIIEIVDYH
jgi:plasmid maintenance system killer protein